MNAVHTLNMVQSDLSTGSGGRHLALVPADRRARRRDQTRRRILAATDTLLAEHGLDGITMQRLADHLDCAVGTLYLYFPSKAALVAALQGQAVDTLRASYQVAREGWALYLDEAVPDLTGRALVGLCAFGAHWASAAVVFADEFALQRRLLADAPRGASARDTAGVREVLDRLLAVPTELVAGAETAGALDRGDARERALIWLAALDGVLLLDRLAPVDRHLLRAPHLARRLTEDLLCGWGAERREVEVADAHVQRLTALGPLAPPPAAPGFE
jgi:AcrR family transcriptional regulator